MLATPNVAVMTNNKALLAFVLWIAAFLTDVSDGANAILMWSSERLEFGSTGIYFASALPQRQRFYRNFVLSTRLLMLKSPHFISSFDSNYRKSEITFMDTGRGNVATMSTRNRALVRSHKGITKQASALAVDWISGNIYWTDQGHKWIYVTSSNFSHSTAIIRNVATPKGIAVYPQKGLVFWSELGKDFGGSKIMRATLSGAHPTPVVETMGAPEALTVDYDTDRIYWIDKSEMAIYYVNINGPYTPTFLFSNTSLVLTDLHVYQQWVYVAANNANQILMLNKTTGNVVHTIGTHLPTAVTVVGRTAQPKLPGPCDIKNGGCDQFCFAQPPGNLRTCGCSLGMTLGADGTSCVSKTLKTDFHLVVDSDMPWIFQVAANGQKFVKLSIPSLNIPVQTQFDSDTGQIYWTDIGSSTINRAELDGSNHLILARNNVRQPTGLALDRYSKNLYWTDEGIGSISVIRTDGTHRKTLLSKNISLPRGLVIDPILGYMWWTDWGEKTIEMANMDGSGRRIIVDRDVEWVNGIAIDKKESKLFWCDAKQDMIEMSDLDGKNRKVVKRFSHNSTHLFGIDVYEDYIYWTDWDRSSVMRMRKDDVDLNEEEFGPHVFDKASDVHSFIGRETLTLENGTSPCQDANGNCNGLCIPVPRNRTSVKNQLQESEDAEYSTIRVCLCGDEHNETCDLTPNATDSVPPSFNGTCVRTLTFVAPPCASEALVDYAIPEASDDSGKVKLKLPANPPPVYLSDGMYDHQYTAIDEAGNHDTCVIAITVQVIRCGSPEEYLQDFSANVVNTSCGNLRGSRVLTRCLHHSKYDEVQYLTCGQDGKWIGHPTCLLYEPSDAETGSVPTEAPIEPKASEKSGKETDIESNSDAQGKEPTSGPVEPKTAEKSLTETDANGSRNVEGKESVIEDKHEDQTPLSHRPTVVPSPDLNSATVASTTTIIIIIIPIVVAVVIVIVAALCYKYYRSNSIPLLAAMEKTLKYRNDDAYRDTFTLDLSERADASQGVGTNTNNRNSLPRVDPMRANEAGTG